jgi:serine-type D-Ala-D-Ala carboxypeptidase/endopeptidase (penicillin-binding protein 4)
VNRPRAPFPAVFLALAALLVCAPAPAAAAPAVAADTALTAKLSQSLSVPHVSAARSGALALDLRTREVVFAHRSGLSLAPASTEKLPVTYALLVNLGPSYRIATRVFGEGDLDGTTWHGDLVLKGYGDPTLGAAGLRKLAAQVRAFGIRRVTGSVVGDESYFDERRVGPGWRPSYLQYSAPLSALVVDRARYGRSVTHRPALAAAGAFRSALVAAGVQVAGGARLGRTSESWELADIESPPLLQLVRIVNRHSDNFVAEQLLKHLGAVEAGKGTTAAGAAVVTRTLRDSGIPLAGVRVADGSGLSLNNRLTANALVGILQASWTDPTLRPVLVSSLAVAGREGTLRRRLRGTPAAGRVVAKTGTTLQASALAGYVDGRYAFAVLQNGSPVSHTWARTAQDRFVTVLARSEQR